LFIVLWSNFLYIFKHFLLLVSCKSAIILSFKVWLSFVWIRISIWIHVNIRYFEIPQHRTWLPTSVFYYSVKAWYGCMCMLLYAHTIHSCYLLWWETLALALSFPSTHFDFIVSLHYMCKKIQLKYQYTSQKKRKNRLWCIN
jgi:hypothetical protein